MYIASYNLEDMHHAGLIRTTDRLMFQGHKILGLNCCLKNFMTDIMHDLIEKYQRSVKEIVNDSFPYD